MIMLKELTDAVHDIETTLKILKLDVVLSAFINLIIIIVLFKLTNLFINKLKEHAKKTDSSMLYSRLIPVLDRLTKFLILFFVIASFLQSNGYSITSLVAGVGITGLAVGFAAQQTIADVFGTIAIMTDKMYKIGDYIKINDIEGVVEDINILSTKIRTLDDFLINLPNNNVSSAVIINLSRANKRRINEVFTLTYDTSEEKLKQAMEILKNICKTNKNLYDNPLIVIDSLSASSIDIKLQVYAKTKSAIELAQIKSDVILEVVKQYNAENINFAFPSQSIYIEKK